VKRVVSALILAGVLVFHSMIFSSSGWLSSQNWIKTRS
jgi:hypothetical protein